MKRRNVILVGLCVAVAGVAPEAGAQSLSAVRTTDFGIAVGAAFPVGNRLRGPQPFTGAESPAKLDVAGGASTGFTVAASMGIRPVNSPVGYRLEAQYTRFGLEPEARFGPGGAPETAEGHVSSLSGTGNIILVVPLPSPLRPCLIGGAGAYLLTSDITQEPNSTFGAQSQTKFGLNGGVGVEVIIGRLRSFVEARYHSVFTEGQNASFIPITVGLKF